MENLFTTSEWDRVSDALEARLQWDRSRVKLLARLAYLGKERYLRHPSTGYRGLAHLVTREALQAGAVVPKLKPVPPRGWRMVKELNRNCAWIMPAWLAIPVRFQQEWQWHVFEKLSRLGLWWVTQEGGYWIMDGRFTLPKWLRRIWHCFINDRDECTTFIVQDGPTDARGFRTFMSPFAQHSVHHYVYEDDTGKRHTT